ncbi:MAG: hypothetical protein QXN96_02745 [Candidatus Bathyarchaeia archaeon]
MRKVKKFVKNYTNQPSPYPTLILILTLTLTLTIPTQADPCQDIINRLVKPPPAIAILDTRQGYRLIDPKERYEIISKYQQDIKQISELLGKYIALRKQTEEINAYLNWQWQRVSAGMEYKKDIWKEQIRENQTRAELKNVERQLLLLGATPKELDLCYTSK